MQKKTDFGADSIREKLTDASPFLIITCFVLSLVSFGVLKYNYQVALFSVNQSSISVPIALLIALVSQLGRLAFGLVGVRDLVRGKKLVGILGILASIALTLYEHWEINRMVKFWKNEDLWFPIAFLVWLALIAELRLMMTMSDTNNQADLEEQRLLEAEQKEEERRQAEQQRMERQLQKQFEIREKENELNRRLQYLRDKEVALQQEQIERKAKLEAQHKAKEEKKRVKLDKKEKKIATSKAAKKKNQPVVSQKELGNGQALPTNGQHA